MSRSPKPMSPAKDKRTEAETHAAPILDEPGCEADQSLGVGTESASATHISTKEAFSLIREASVVMVKNIVVDGQHRNGVLAQVYSKVGAEELVLSPVEGEEGPYAGRFSGADNPSPRVSGSSVFLRDEDGVELEIKPLFERSLEGVKPEPVFQPQPNFTLNPSYVKLRYPLLNPDGAKSLVADGFTPNEIFTMSNFVTIPYPLKSGVCLEHAYAEQDGLSPEYASKLDAFFKAVDKGIGRGYIEALSLRGCLEDIDGTKPADHAATLLYHGTVLFDVNLPVNLQPACDVLAGLQGVKLPMRVFEALSFADEHGLPVDISLAGTKSLLAVSTD